MSATVVSFWFSLAPIAYGAMVQLLVYSWKWGEFISCKNVMFEIWSHLANSPIIFSIFHQLKFCCLCWGQHWWLWREGDWTFKTLKLSKFKNENSYNFRFSWNAIRVLLWFLSRSLLSSQPSLNSGRHILHLDKVSGLLEAKQTKVWHEFDNLDNCQFQGSLVQRGSWEGR